MRFDTAALPGVFKHRKMASLAEASGLTNRALAELVQVNQGTVARWAKGNAVPSPSFIARLAEVLDVPAVELYHASESARSLTYYRVIAGYSLAQLAPKVGTSPVHLGRMEAGQSSIPPYVYGRLQQLLDLDDQTMKRAVGRSLKRQLQQRKRRSTPPMRCEIVREGRDPELVGA